METSTAVESRTPARTAAIIFFGLIAGVATVVGCAVAGFGIGVLAPRLGWAKGELAMWLPIMLGIYGILAGIAMGPTVSWLFISKRFGLPPTVRISIAAGLLALIAIAEYAIYK